MLCVSVRDAQNKWLNFKLYLGDLAGLVVAPKNCDSLPEPHFQCHQQSYLECTMCEEESVCRMMRDRFDAVVSSVDVVAHEKVICVGRLAADAEKLHEVVELTVYVAAYSHRAFHLNDGHPNVILALNKICDFL